MPVLSSARDKAYQTQCSNNLKQLSAGMMNYTHDYEDAFPGLASLHNGYHPEDWIYWRTNDGITPPVEKSPVLVEGGNAARTILRCPMDRTDDERLAEVSDANGPYLYSYSLTGYGVSLTEFWGLDGNQNFGLASVFTGDINNPTVSIFKQSSLMNPSRKIMLAEEPGTKDPKDNPQENWIVIQDGRWMPDRDWLTVRHGGKANVAFADAHQEMVTWQFGTNFVNSRADF